MRESAPLALLRAADRLLDGATLGAVLLQVFPSSTRVLEVTAGMQRVVLRNTRSNCEPGERAPAKSAHAFFADEPIRDSEAKEVRQAFVLVLDHWRHAQTGETHSVGWYAARLGLEKRQVERYYTALSDLLALHVHQPPDDADGVPRGPSGHPYNLTTWVMGLSTKTMRRDLTPREPLPAPTQTRGPITPGGLADMAWALKLTGAGPAAPS